MIHDGENECKKDDKFIMASSIGLYPSDDIHNSFLFSNCSLGTLNFTIQNLADMVDDM